MSTGLYDCLMPEAKTDKEYKKKSGFTGPGSDNDESSKI
jgi:hypothetical protein